MDYLSQIGQLMLWPIMIYISLKLSELVLYKLNKSLKEEEAEK